MTATRDVSGSNLLASLPSWMSNPATGWYQVLGDDWYDVEFYVGFNSANPAVSPVGVLSLWCRWDGNTASPTGYEFRSTASGLQTFVVGGTCELYRWSAGTATLIKSSFAGTTFISNANDGQLKVRVIGDRLSALISGTELEVEFGDAGTTNEAGVTDTTIAGSSPTVCGLAIQLGASLTTDVSQITARKLLRATARVTASAVAGMSAVDSTDLATYTTASWTPVSGEAYILYVQTAKGSVPETPTVTGNSMTWVEVATVNTAAQNKRLTAFRGQYQSATAGAITIAHAGVVQLGCAWSLSKVTGADLSGTFGSAMIGRSASANDGGTGTATATWGTLASGEIAELVYGESGLIVGVGKDANSVMTPDAATVELNDVGGTLPARQMSVAWLDGNDTGAWLKANGSTTWTGADRWNWITIELRPALPSRARALGEFTTGIGSTAALGVPTRTATITRAVTGIASTAAFGVPSASISGASQTRSVTGRASTLAVGTPTSALSITRAVTGIGSTAALGTPTSALSITRAVTGIGSTVAFGTPSASISGASQTRSVTGRASTLVVGTLTLYVLTADTNPFAVKFTDQGIIELADAGVIKFREPAALAVR